MRVMVTGAAGFVGRATLADLRRRGHEVDAVVRPGRAVPAAVLDPSVQVVHADLRTGMDAVAARLGGVDAVIHLAAAARGTPRERFDSTVLATAQLLASVAAAGWRGRFVHVSSFQVYAFNQLPPGATIDEETPLEPRPERRDEHTWTKSWQERLVREAVAAGDLDATIVRPAPVYGPGRRAQPRLGRSLGTQTLLLIGGTAVLASTYVENIASLLAECAEHFNAGGQVFNAVDPDPPREWQYALRWRAAGDGPRRILPLPRAALRALRAGYVAAGRATDGAIRAPGLLDPYAATPTVARFRWDGSKARHVLGWEPPIPRDLALDRTFGVAHA